MVTGSHPGLQRIAHTIKLILKLRTFHNLPLQNDILEHSQPLPKVEVQSSYLAYRRAMKKTMGFGKIHNKYLIKEPKIRVLGLTKLVKLSCPMNSTQPHQDGSGKMQLPKQLPIS